MPLPDHVRPPLDDLRHWEGLHATWPVMIVALLRRKLARRYFAELRVHSGSSIEIVVATSTSEGEGALAIDDANDNGGIAAAVWAPPRPTLSVVTDLPAQDVYEVLVYDEKRHCRLVAAVEVRASDMGLVTSGPYPYIQKREHRLFETRSRIHRTYEDISCISHGRHF